MTYDPYPWFTKHCLSAFAFLVTEYEFDTPIIKQLAHERYVKYCKSKHTVSIVYSPDALPLIELFHPTDEINNRYIPRLKTEQESGGKLRDFINRYHKLCKAGRYGEADALVKNEAPQLETEMEAYLEAQALALKKQESEFLRGGTPGSSTVP